MFASHLIFLFFIISAFESSIMAMFPGRTWSGCPSYSPGKSLVKLPGRPERALTSGRWYTYTCKDAVFFIHNLSEKQVMIEDVGISERRNNYEYPIASSLPTQNEICPGGRLSLWPKGTERAMFLPTIQDSPDRLCEFINSNQVRVETDYECKCHEDIVKRSGLCVPQDQCTMNLIPEDPRWYEDKGFKFK